MVHTLFLLLAGHALADFAFQGEAMALGKNRNPPATGGPREGKEDTGVPWPYWMGAHALIHGGLVAVITGSVWLGIAETVVHFGIDFAKCEGWTNIHSDQALHVLCKVVWVAL